MLLHDPISIILYSCRRYTGTARIAAHCFFSSRVYRPVSLSRWPGVAFSSSSCHVAGVLSPVAVGVSFHHRWWRSFTRRGNAGVQGMTGEALIKTWESWSMKG